MAQWRLMYQLLLCYRWTEHRMAHNFNCSSPPVNGHSANITDSNFWDICSCALHVARQMV